MPIAVSLNLMLDRLSTLTQRGAAYEQLLSSIRLLQEALDRNTQGQPAWLEEQLSTQIATDLRPILMQLSYLQRAQQSHLQRLTNTITLMNPLMLRLREALTEVRNSSTFKELDSSTVEHNALERAARVETQIEQMQKTLLGQISTNVMHIDEHMQPTPRTSQAEFPQKSSQQQQMEAWQSRRNAGRNAPPSTQNW